jgi:hypothetical protein
MKRIAIAAAVVAAAALTIVIAVVTGGDDDTTRVTGNQERSAGAATQREPMPIDDLVQQLMDDGLPVRTVAPDETGPHPFIRESVIANLGDGRSPVVESFINTFDSLEAREGWLEAVRSLGGFAIIRGDELWAVSPDSDLPNSDELARQFTDSVEGAELVASENWTPPFATEDGGESPTTGEGDPEIPASEPAGEIEPFVNAPNREQILADAGDANGDGVDDCLMMSMTDGEYELCIENGSDEAEAREMGYGG